ncbi:MAG: 1-acyl-sn-glycerol-3-phosphate acyltransferase [Bacteroidetes bacterium]|nr:1-acyl-sn-glycerol-3-phosphate acyltransferase [Bacteroidota bacterium]
MFHFSYFIYSFFQKRKLVFLILILAACGGLGFLASKIKLEEDITRFVPSDKNSQSINSILDNLKSKDKLIIHVSSKYPENIDQLIAHSDSVYSRLTSKLTKDDYTDMTFTISDDRFQQIYDLFYQNLPLFLETKDYEKISRLITKDSIDATIERDYATLLSPQGMALGKYIRRDPLNFTPIALKKLQNIQLDENFETYNNHIVTKDHQHLLMFITPAHLPNDTKGNKHLIQVVDSACHSFSDDTILTEAFGSCIVSAGNANQLRKDSIYTSSIAVIVIALLLGLYFKNPLVTIFILFPVGFGMVFALSFLFLLKGVVSAIAIGAGAVVLGIAINYSLHFFTHYKHNRDVKTVLQDLTVPMLIGCTTTVGAFLSLLFAKSEALHDFGLFAAFSLIGAMLFSILVLPQLLKFSFRKDKEIVHVEGEHHSWIDRLTAYRFDKNKVIVISAFVLTLVFTFFAGDVAFESDMNKMSFMTKETRDAEKHLDDVNNFAARSVYVFSNGNTLNEALDNNVIVSDKLEAFKQQGLIKKYSSVSALFISDKEQGERINRWNAFFTKAKKDSIKQQLITAGLSYKFKETAFQSFYDLLNSEAKPLSKADSDTLNKLLFKEWIGKVNGKPSIINHVKVDAENRQAIYKAFENNPNIVVFDKQNLTAKFVEVISSDFNTILLITSVLVFGFMLLNHGRIELAVINFLPMLISWLWILGIMGIFGIKFNIINIIISTFIFGLGDDYSIFIMDGLLNEYKFGKKNLDSFKSSILLSALITIIGIGVMVFAKHPALQSIAIITIIGMVCVVFISFVAQPLLFNWMILNRRHKGLLPYSAKYILITIVGFCGFLIGSLLITLCGIILFTVFPAKTATRKLIFHYIIMYTFRFILACFFNVKKTIINPHHETFEKPAIIVSNHQSHIDLALTLQLYPKIVVFTNDWVYNSPFYGWIVKKADYYKASDGYDNCIPSLTELVKQGYSILIFPEGTRSVTGDILRFHKGAFLLAEQMQLDIIPLLLHGAGDTVTKGDFHFKDGSLAVKILNRIKPDDKSFGATYQERSKAVCKLMRQEYQLLKDERETVSYFRARLIRNYIFKGPVLEWYCRIKTALENNYELFESLMPKTGKIVDVGCGYGFLPYMLMFKGRQREILGVDYDDEKITVADNCVDKSDKLSFDVGDVTVYDFPQADGFIISDVLHYLKEEQQVQVIENCVAKLNKGGVLVIRDADKDIANRQKGTWYTEFMSTKVLGFNKTKEDGLHFVSGTLIKDTIAKFPHLTLEVIDNTKLTSNIIYVVKHSG